MKHNKETLAEWLHNNYEDIASKTGWNTQENCKTSFKDLPQKNKKTMLLLAERIIDEILNDCFVPQPKRGICGINEHNSDIKLFGKCNHCGGVNPKYRKSLS